MTSIDQRKKTKKKKTKNKSQTHTKPQTTQPLPFLFIIQRQTECSLLFAFFPAESQASAAPSFQGSAPSKNKPSDTSNTLYK